MALQHVLGDGEPEPGTAAHAAAGEIDSIKTFGDARYVFRGYANAVVADAKVRRAAVAWLPCDVDGTTIRAVAHGIVV